MITEVDEVKEVAQAKDLPEIALKDVRISQFFNRVA
jgi:hypothetical protein